MRMDPIGTKLTAADILAQATTAELTDIFKRFGNVSQAHRLSEKIVRVRASQPYLRVQDLRETVFQYMEATSADSKYNMLSKVFQALRIFINNEAGNLEALIDSIPAVWNHSVIGEKLPFLGLILTFHSQEQQLAMASLGKLRKSQEQLGRGFQFLERNLGPTSEEVSQNTPSRSANLIAFELNGTTAKKPSKGLLTESRSRSKPSPTPNAA